MAKKVIKVTSKQLQNIIAEEASRYKRVLELKKKKDSIISQLNEMYEPSELEELGIEEGLGDALKAGMQKVTNAFTKSYVLNGQYLPKSKNKGNVLKYGKQIQKLMALGMSEAQAQEAVAMLLDNNQMVSYANGHVTPTFDKATGNIKFASTAAISSNPNPTGE
jgi:dGTP triphosphohydrolase